MLARPRRLCQKRGWQNVLVLLQLPKPVVSKCWMLLDATENAKGQRICSARAKGLPYMRVFGRCRMARTPCADSSFFTGRCSLRIIEEVLQYFHGLGRVFFVLQQLHHIHSWVGVRRKLARQHAGYFFRFENASREFCVYVRRRTAERPYSHQFHL